MVDCSYAFKISVITTCHESPTNSIIMMIIIGNHIAQFHIWSLRCNFAAGRSSQSHCFTQDMMLLKAQILSVLRLWHPPLWNYTCSSPVPWVGESFWFPNLADWFWCRRKPENWMPVAVIAIVVVFQTFNTKMRISWQLRSLWCISNFITVATVSLRWISVFNLSTLEKCIDNSSSYK